MTDNKKIAQRVIGFVLIVVGLFTTILPLMLGVLLGFTLNLLSATNGKGPMIDLEYCIEQNYRSSGIRAIIAKNNCVWEQIGYFAK